MSRLTCADCPHLIKVGSRNWFFGCEATGYVVPHQADYIKDLITFWRVPLDCPLPDTEVCKSATQAPKKDWVVMTSADIRAGKA